MGADRPQRLRSQLAELSRGLEGAAYPFDHADAETTLQSYIVPEPPEDLDLGLYELAGYALDHAFEVYFRLVGRLAFIAEQLERGAGLEALPRVRAATSSPAPVDQTVAPSPAPVSQPAAEAPGTRQSPRPAPSAPPVKKPSNDPKPWM